jgi:hypothetical protein
LTQTPQNTVPEKLCRAPQRAQELLLADRPGSGGGPLNQAARGLAAAAAAALLALGPALDASALLNSPNAQIPRTVDAALRRAIPAFNPDVRALQDSLESIAFKLRIPQRKPWSAMADDLGAATTRAGNEDAMLTGVLPPDREDATALVADIKTGLGRLLAAVELKDPSRTSVRLAAVLEKVAKLELLQAPGLPYQLPRQYKGYPQLRGRAVAELVVEKADGSRSFIDPTSDAGPQKQARIRIVLDGYSGEGGS